MGKTAIAWTDFSVNPVRARDGAGHTGHHCEKVSPGCQNCYASRMHPRFGLPEYSGPSRRSDVVHFLDEGRLRSVLARKTPTRYFWADMTDLFGEWVPDDWLDACFAVMALTSRHTHQLLTKRPERMAAYLADRSKSSRHWEAAARSLGYALRFEHEGQSFSLCPFPLPNVWLGVSVESQEWAGKRIPHLLETPAAVRFLSCEPLLGPLNLHPFLCENGSVERPEQRWCESTCTPRGALHWVICGGESGPGFRPMAVEWAASLRDQCRAAGVPFFMKQDSGARPGTQGRIPDDLWAAKEFPVVTEARHG